jgi:monofunctional glycosyltransferase
MRHAGRGLAILLAGMLGSLAYLYATLPDVRPLRTANPASTAFMELRAREAVRRGQPPRRDHRWVPYDRISPHLKRAVLTAEDSAFWTHDGLDYVQIRASLEINLARRQIARGGSTVTQQLAKNLYLSPSRSPARKLREVLIARRLEVELGKRRILELYLNVIEWGDGTYGAEAAARRHFGKPAALLTREEAALLAGAIISPLELNPARPSPRLVRRQQIILRRMASQPLRAAAHVEAPATGGAAVHLDTAGTCWL